MTSLKSKFLNSNITIFLKKNYILALRRKSETKGRYVVSTKDLVPNDTIIRERAFVLVPVYGEEYVPGKSRPFCSNCASTLTKSLYDCKSCHRISYCSEQCRRQDETRRIHRYQCNGHVMGLFHDLGVSHLAMHALLAGIAERFDEIPVDFLKEIAKDASELETFGYSRVLRLSTNFSQMSEDDYLRFVLVSFKSIENIYIYTNNRYFFIDRNHVHIISEKPHRFPAGIFLRARDWSSAASTHRTNRNYIFYSLKSTVEFLLFIYMYIKF